VAVVEHDQAVHAGDRRQPVRDRNHGLACHQRAETLLDRGLDLRIERGARELYATLADVGLIAPASLPVLERKDELIGVRELGRGDYLGLGCGGAAVADVVGDRAVQERRVLGNHGNLAAQAHGHR
jgi:hypothetical protein